MMSQFVLPRPPFSRRSADRLEPFMWTMALLSAARCFSELARLASTLRGNWLVSRKMITNRTITRNAKALGLRRF